jgi:hypothetical protein
MWAVQLYRRVYWARVRGRRRHRTWVDSVRDAITPGLTGEDLDDRIQSIGLALLNLELKLYPTMCFLS